MKVTRNFDFDKLVKSDATAQWLNQYGNRIARAIHDGLKKGEDIEGNAFKPVGDFTKKSKHDGKAHTQPLVRSGRLLKSIKKLPATAKKLSFWIKSNVKSKARWNITVDGKKYQGTRKSRGVNYGAIHQPRSGESFMMVNYTSKESFIPDKKLPERVWFGIPPRLLVGGSEWNTMKDLVYYWNIGMKIKASRLGQK